ncbi:DNA breaking-rejoining enzyme, partial [Lyophyllum atratum]
MPDTPALRHALTGVDVALEAEQFYARMATSSSADFAPHPPIGRIRRPRKPRPENVIESSPLRPHVLASERLRAWSTPVTLPFRECLVQALPSCDARALLEVMLFSLDEETRSNYGAGLLRFTQYCDSRSIPESQRMPASDILLCGFSTAMAAGKVARTTLDNWLAGIRFWHLVNGAVWNGEGSEMLKAVKRGVSKLVPVDAKRAKRPPVTIEHMHALRAGLNLSDAFDAAVWALACIAYWSCCRLGELLVPSAGTFNPAKHVSRATRRSSRSSSSATSTTFDIPWTKTTGFEGASIVVTKIDEPSDPHAALLHHLNVNSGVPGSAPFFAFSTADGGWAPMTRDWFLNRCEGIWEDAGMPRLTGHAFRIGGATELLLRGVDPMIVRTQGRWKSDAFLEYWRRIDGILSLFMTNAFAEDRANLARKSMH